MDETVLAQKGIRSLRVLLGVAFATVVLTWVTGDLWILGGALAAGVASYSFGLNLGLLGRARRARSIPL